MSKEIERTEEICANIRIEFELALTALRQYNAIHYSIAGILIPITTVGFTIKNNLDNEIYICSTGLCSIFIWLFFIMITRFYIIPEVQETTEYVKSLSNQLKELTDQNRQNYMELIEVFKSPTYTYVDLFNIIGFMICAGWIYHIVELYSK